MRFSLNCQVKRSMSRSKRGRKGALSPLTTKNNAARSENIERTRTLGYPPGVLPAPDAVAPFVGDVGLASTDGEGQGRLEQSYINKQAQTLSALGKELIDLSLLTLAFSTIGSSSGSSSSVGKR